MTWRVTDEEALEVRCPKCKAKRDNVCTYLADRTTWKRDVDSHGNSFYYQDGNRKGEQCKVPHNERRDVVRRKRRLARQEAREAERATPPAALMSLYAFDQAEHERLREWLRQHGSVFWESRQGAAQ